MRCNYLLLFFVWYELLLHYESSFNLLARRRLVNLNNESQSQRTSYTSRSWLFLLSSLVNCLIAALPLSFGDFTDRDKNMARRRNRRPRTRLPSRFSRFMELPHSIERLNMDRSHAQPYPNSHRQPASSTRLRPAKQHPRTSKRESWLQHTPKTLLHEPRRWLASSVSIPWVWEGLIKLAYRSRYRDNCPVFLLISITVTLAVLALSGLNSVQTKG